MNSHYIGFRSCTLLVRENLHPNQKAKRNQEAKREQEAKHKTSVPSERRTFRRLSYRRDQNWGCRTEGFGIAAWRPDKGLDFGEGREGAKSEWGTSCPGNGQLTCNNREHVTVVSTVELYTADLFTWQIPARRQHALGSTEIDNPQMCPSNLPSAPAQLMMAFLLACPDRAFYGHRLT